ncbi:hypothetical protein MXB_3116, partial [Myxobolus squamalis]
LFQLNTNCSCLFFGFKENFKIEFVKQFSDKDQATDIKPCRLAPFFNGQFLFIVLNKEKALVITLLHKLLILRSFAESRTHLLTINICRIIMQSKPDFLYEWKATAYSSDLQLNMADFITLMPKNYLNDTIIDFYMR